MQRFAPVSRAAASPRRRSRLAAPLLALLVPLLASGGAAVAADAAPAVAPAAPGLVGQPHPVQDPHFGDVLFQLYQDRPFAALTSLMVSEQFARMQHHAEEAELTRGGLLLSYGLHQEAGAIFDRLLAGHPTPALRDRVWFQLARLRYQRGFMAEAKDAIGRIDKPLPGAQQEDRLLLQAQIQMGLEDYAGAVATLEPLVASSPKARYARYNLGVALVRGGDVSRGIALLDALGKAPAENEEYRQLRDKANVALGYAALREDRAAEARGYLERVRLKSPQATRALLGFGWASLKMGAPREALVPWTELLGREPGEAAVLEARLAVPYTQAELGAYGLALTNYEAAIGAYDQERRRLDESIAAIRAGRLVDDLAERNPGHEMGWADSIESLPELPHAGHLNAVLAQHGFQEAFKNYRDLRQLRENLAGWQDKLVLYREMLEHRRAGFEQRLAAVTARSRELGGEALAARRQAMAAELQRAEKVGDGYAFADDRQRQLGERLERVQLTLAEHADDRSLDPARERARLVAGALDWELSQALPEKLWQTRKGLQALDRELQLTTKREQALRQAQRDEPARFAAYAARLAAIGPRLDAMLPQVTALERAQQLALQDLAVAALQAQKERLDGYTAQARLAVARLYDNATVSRTADHAPTR